MNVSFFSADPKDRARPMLDSLLSQGVDQIAIACAFVTGGGAKVIARHAKTLKKQDSFLVASWDYPTDGGALAETLHDLEDARYFIEFFSYHAEKLAELHGAAVQFHKSKLAYAFVHATKGLAGLARDIDG